MVLFGQRKERYDGEHAPEPVLCWSEFEVDDNPDGWEKAVHSKKAAYAEGFQAFRIVAVNVDGDKIRKLLLGMPVVEGGVETGI